MIRSITIHLKGKPDAKYSYNMASIFQSALMQVLEPAYAEALHADTMHPYSQYLCTNQEDVYWTVNTLNTDASEKIISALESNCFQKVHLDARDEDLIVVDKVLHEESYEGMIEKYYFGDGNPYLHLRFLTPVSFKSDGQYMIFPTSKLIFQNLMMKYDASSEESEIYSEELVREFDAYASIVNYRLKSTSFYIAGARIPSFIGDLTIKIRGTRQLANVARMLAEFGRYSGVGIKTGMGMGAMQVINEAERGNKERTEKNREGKGSPAFDCGR